MEIQQETWHNESTSALLAEYEAINEWKIANAGLWINVVPKTPEKERELGDSSIGP